MLRRGIRTISTLRLPNFQQWNSHHLNSIRIKSYEPVKSQEEFNYRVEVLQLLCHKVWLNPIQYSNKTVDELSELVDCNIGQHNNGNWYVHCDRDILEDISRLAHQIGREKHCVGHKLLSIKIGRTILDVFDSINGSKYNK